MDKTHSLSLIVIDEEQLLAEKIVKLLANHHIVCRMTLLDEQKELIKALRKKWDIILYGRTYDLSIEQVMEQIKSHDQDIPLIAMIDPPAEPLNTLDATDKRTVDYLAKDIADAHPREQLTRIVYAIKSQLYHLSQRRKFREIKNVLNETEMRATLLLKNSRSAIAYISEGMHIYVNEAYYKMFGYSNEQDLIGMPVIDIIAGNKVSEFKALLTNFMKGDRSQLEFMFDSVKPDGTTFGAKLQLASAIHEGEPCTQIIIQQHNQNSEEMQAQLAAAERTDNLTGLGNRRAFDEDLKKARSSAINNHETHGLVYVTIDNIGQINASFGIAGTDAIIKHISSVIEKHFPGSEIHRFSDTTFTVIIYHTDKDKLLSASEAVRAEIAEALIEVEKRTARTTVSIGIALISETSPSTSELFERAYNAVDKVRKQTEGNGIHIYDPYANAAQSKTALFEAVNNALDRNMFQLVFQPIYSVNEDSSNFYEVYLRLPLPNGESLSPDKFLDIAEQCNMLERLDRWVMLNATKMLRKELKTDPNARLLINLSGSAIQDKALPDFASKLIKAIGNHKSPLTLQFNEHDVSNYLSIAKEQFIAFRAAGCQISINNFGSSLKSVDLFVHAQPNFVKLDRSYSKDLGEQENLAATTSFVSEIKAKDVQPLMAFIEDAATMSAAWRIGAPFLQGIYLQPPSSELSNSSES